MPHRSTSVTFLLQICIIFVAILYKNLFAFRDARTPSVNAIIFKNEVMCTAKPQQIAMELKYGWLQKDVVSRGKLANASSLYEWSQ